MNKDLLKKFAVFAGLITFFVIINIPISINKYYKRNTYFSDDSYVRTINMAGLFNGEGVGRYRISFQACCNVDGRVQVLLENESRYCFENEIYLDFSRKYEDYAIEADVMLFDLKVRDSFLCLRGISDEIKPSVRFITVEKIDVEQ